jgi:hypothetical protein
MYVYGHHVSNGVLTAAVLYVRYKPLEHELIQWMMHNAKQSVGCY